MTDWRISVWLFFLGVALGFGLGRALNTSLPHAVAQSDESTRLLRSIEQHLRHISRSVENIDRNFDRVRDWDAVRVRVRQ
ncbi:hypothetical protein HRbin17_01056 [bacterium HR17]|jgi:hypothetical protein|uniref:Uncharacterized protein n=1 Tax=Candidatus Fervidibacter japonicus TaxID=2035412 RepID=A0A2H5XBI4_9BACT|nr:hypothetical protein HRbin17_01056 [bacterium HR17]